GGSTPSRRSRSSVISLLLMAAPSRACIRSRSSPGNSWLLVLYAICYATIMVVELHQERDLEQLLERSHKDPVVIFKHSTQCSRSAGAYEEYEAFMADNPDTPCGTVLVIEDRE